MDSIDLFAEAWGEPEPNAEPEPEITPTVETPGYVGQVGPTVRAVDEPGETAPATEEFLDAPTAEAPNNEAPEPEPASDTEVPAPEPQLEPVSAPEVALQANSAEIALDGDATPTMDRSLPTNGLAPTTDAGDTALLTNGVAPTTDAAGNTVDIVAGLVTEPSAAVAAAAQTSGANSEFEASSETHVAAAVPPSPPDFTEVDEIRQTELHSAVSGPVPATLTPTQEAHEILGAKGKNQNEAMEVAKKKRAAKRAARAERATLDDPVEVEEALVI